MSLVLAVDDDRSVLHLVRHCLHEHEVITGASAAECLELLAGRKFDVVLLDIVLPDASGLEVFKRIQDFDSRLPVIFMTSDESSQTVIEAMTLGAFDYVTKPIDLGRLDEAVTEALRTRRQMVVDVALPTDDKETTKAKDALIGRSPGMLEVYGAIGRCARRDVPVLIRGESGTGKELVARAIYQHGGRADRPFLTVNCAAMSESLLESELFGHEKGAFTGATSRRIGKFESCDGGTIFLDEIGDMSLSVQAKVLRLLQQQEFQRVGGNETIRTDVRIISATNRPLEEMCADKSFREDLFFRLNGYPIHIPPLRERGDDRRLLLEHFVGRFVDELGLERFEGVSPEALRILMDHDWPGNVREMQAVVRQALLDCRGPVLVPEFLPPLARKPGERPGAKAPTAPTRRVEADDIEEDSSEEITADETLLGFINRRLPVSKNLYAETVDYMERKLVIRVLTATRGNQSRAAEILGITRGKLRNRVRLFGLDLGALNGSEFQAS